MHPIRLGIVSADQLMRDFLRLTIPVIEPRFTCVLESPCDDQAAQRCHAAGPDLVVFDLAGRGSFELLTLGALSGPATRWSLLVIGNSAPTQTVCEFVTQKPCGFFSRSNSLDSLARAAFLVATGGTYLDASLHNLLFKRRALPASPGLSQRERHVLQLIAEGYSTKEVADILRLSVKTVDKYRTTVMQKLDVHDVVRLTHCAIRMGFVSVS